MRIVAMAALALLAGVAPAMAAKLHILSPLPGHVYHPGEKILAQAKPDPGVVNLPTWQVKWEITCTSCGNPPTYASVFTQQNMLTPPAGYDMTVGAVDANGSYCARAILYPDQPGWDWSDKVCFSWSDGKTITRIDPHKLTKPPPFTKDPGPVKPVNPATSTY